jgi:hypothetical protein
MKKVVLIGHSIRMAYQPFVTQQLRPIAQVWAPAENCGPTLSPRCLLPRFAVYTRT